MFSIKIEVVFVTVNTKDPESILSDVSIATLILATASALLSAEASILLPLILMV